MTDVRHYEPEDAAVVLLLAELQAAAARGDARLTVDLKALQLLLARVALPADLQDARMVDGIVSVVLDRMRARQGRPFRLP